MLRKLVIAFPLAGIALVAMHMYALDGLDGWLLSFVMGDDTMYASRYADDAFRKVRVGMPEEEARQLLGPPLREVWNYREHAISLPTIDLVGDRVVEVNASVLPALRTVKVGMTRSVALAAAGEPRAVSLVYSRTLHDQSYRMRAVLIENGRVAEKTAKFYVD